MGRMIRTHAVRPRGRSGARRSWLRTQDDPRDPLTARRPRVGAGVSCAPLCLLTRFCGQGVLSNIVELKTRRGAVGTLRP